MKRPVLKAEARKLLGKKVKKLRNEGLLPANVYGKTVKSVALQIKLTDFQQVFKEAGETSLVDLQLDGETRPVLIKNLQLNFRSKVPLHVDFYQVNLKEKVKTTVPVTLVGEAKAVADKVGMLLQTLSEVEIEALPDRIPERLELNVESLAELDASLTVTDLKAPEGVAILTEPTQQVVRVAELVAEEPKAEEAPTEETVPAEGEASTAGAKTEEKPGEAKQEEKK